MRCTHLVVLGLLVLSCRAGSNDGENDAGLDGGDADVAIDVDSPEIPEVDALEVCERYIVCVAETNPGALGLISEQYDEGGSCWQETPELCEAACITGLAQSHQAFPDETACPACLADRHCEDATEPACDVTTGHCVPCTRDEHCRSEAMPACDVSARECVRCTRDEHCGGGETPGCDVATGQCVRCTRDEHCDTGACDLSTHACVACVSDDDCSGDTPACMTAEHRCVECQRDAHCTGELPACDLATATCTTCSNNSHCPGGVCRDGVCCTPMTCEELQATMEMEVCGTTLETRCFSYITGCGTCEVGSCMPILGVCSNAGAPCTVGGGECAAGELCAYNWDTGGRQCAIDDDGFECDPVDDPCLETSACVFGVCRRDCEFQTDCPEGQSCVVHTCEVD